MVLFFPLICSLGTWFLARKERNLTAGFNIAGVVTSFILSVSLACMYGGQAIDCTPFHWLPLDGLDLRIGLHLDRLSTLMLVVVTSVSSLVMVYSAAYMKDDPGYSRFFSTLGLFVFSMLGIVLADNLLMMFIFWELVGVSSYLLIGFWFERPAASDASKKAFITNRLGDFGFIIGIIIVWSATGTLNFSELASKLHQNPAMLGHLASLAGVLIFMGAMGKSAQFPLHVWLPDAMEGPTPVSALIHAATMVAAGVYMLCRVYFIYALPAGWPAAFSFMGEISAATIVAWIGAFTSLLAAVIAIQQNDIKRILAYSTLSQLGYMVMTVGLGAPVGNPSAAMYHLVTHAFFKALLFLGAGSVIHACHHEQDIWRMGGLWKKMPVTFWTFLIGTAALAGVPSFSGFYSKDEILVTALENSPVLFGLAVIVAGLTTFYMSRLVLVAFFGPARSDHASHAHESPKPMLIALVTLAVPSWFIAWLPLGPFLTRHFIPGFQEHGGDFLLGPFNHNPIAALFGFGAVLFGLSGAWFCYAGSSSDPLPAKLGGWSRAMRNRFYFDEIYEAIVVPLHDLVARMVDGFDRWVVSGLGVRGVPGAVEIAGRALRLVQSGSLQTYSFLFAAGAVFAAWLVLR